MRSLEPNTVHAAPKGNPCRFYGAVAAHTHDHLEKCLISVFLTVALQ